MLTKYNMVEIEDLHEIDFSGEVYDIEVEDDSSFTVGERIVVHNCQCETRKNTGVGLPQLSVIKNIRKYLPDAKIISDGGIKCNGDIAKALKYANAVMVGSMLSGTSETPGDVFKNKNGEFYKVFGGSASAENKTKSGMANAFVEGVVSEVPFKGHVKYILRQAKENLQSAFSYQDSLTLPEFQEKAILVKISGGGKQESKI